MIIIAVETYVTAVAKEVPIDDDDIQLQQGSELKIYSLYRFMREKPQTPPKRSSDSSQSGMTK